MMMKAFGCLLLVALGACAPVSDSRVLIGLNHESDELTQTTEKILAAAKRFQRSASAMHSMQVRLNGLKTYHEEIAPCLTESFGGLHERFVDLRLAAFAAKIPSTDLDKAQDDYLLWRRWQPDVQLLATEWTEHDDERWVVVTEVLLDGKIYTGHQTELRFVYRKIGNDWLLDEILHRCRHTYEGSSWDGFDSTRAELSQTLRKYEKELKNARKDRD